MRRARGTSGSLIWPEASVSPTDKNTAKKCHTDRLLEINLEDLLLCQLLVPMSREPDSGQRALLCEHELRIEHLEGDCGGRAVRAGCELLSPSSRQKVAFSKSFPPKLYTGARLRIRSLAHDRRELQGGIMLWWYTVTTAHASVVFQSKVVVDPEAPQLLDQCLHSPRTLRPTVSQRWPKIPQYSTVHLQESSAGLLASSSAVILRSASWSRYQ